MNFGFDHDGTWTVAPREMFNFVIELTGAGHKCYLTTMRYPSEADSLDDYALYAMAKGWLQPIFTSRQAKAPACAAQGVLINVWIDDYPQAVHSDAMSIWGASAPEGAPVVNDHSAPPA